MKQKRHEKIMELIEHYEILLTDCSRRAFG